MSFYQPKSFHCPKYSYSHNQIKRNKWGQLCKWCSIYSSCQWGKTLKLEFYLIGLTRYTLVGLHLTSNVSVTRPVEESSSTNIEHGRLKNTAQTIGVDESF